jgi:hypothetical protein
MKNVIFEKKYLVTKEDYAKVVPASLIHPNENSKAAHLVDLDVDLFNNTTFIKDHRGDVGITKMPLGDAASLFYDEFIFEDEKVGDPFWDYVKQHSDDIVEVHTSLYDYDKNPDDSMGPESKKRYRYHIEIMLPNGDVETHGAWSSPMWCL